MFKNNKSKALLALSLLTTAGVASAALPAEAQTAIDSIATFGTDILAAAWPIVTALTVGFVGMKLFKKAANKAS